MPVPSASAAKSGSAIPQPATPDSSKRQLRKIAAEPLHARVTWSSNAVIAIFSASAIMASLALKLMLGAESVVSQVPLIATLMLCGSLLLAELLKKLVAREFGSDLLAGISIVTSILLGEYLVGSIIVLMLSGGTTLEQFATRRASSVLQALAKRMPRIAHRQQSTNQISDIDVDEIQVGDQLVIFPHEICPVDGSVSSGHSSMNEAYLTGEPFEIAKAPGSGVISGAVNGPNALTITATKLPVDSRYAQIMKVMEETEASRPPLRRLR